MNDRLGTFCGIAGLADERSVSLENPNVPLNDPELWNAIFGSGYTSTAGESVTPDKALSIAAVWQAVSLISGDAARLPLDVFRRVSDDEREMDKSHPAYRLVRRQANSETSAFDFWRTAMTHALIWGNGYAWIVREGNRLQGRPQELFNLFPDRTKPVRIERSLWYETKALDGKVHYLPPESVLHLRGFGFDGTLGAETVKYARDVWGQALAKQRFVSRFFKAGGRHGGILEVPIGASPAFADNLEMGFRKTYENPDAHFRTVVLRDGAKFHAASHSLRDSQMVESGESSVREVARFFNLAPSRLGLSDSVSYNSKSEDNRAYLDSTLAPWLEQIVSQCWMRLLTELERAADSHYFEHNTRALLAMSYKERVATGAIGVRAKLITRDEWRKGENLGPHPDGDGDTSEGMEQVTPAGGADKGENDRPRGPAADDDVRTGRIRAVFDLAAAARRKSSDHRAFFDWIQRRLPESADPLIVEFVTGLRGCDAVPVSELRDTVERVVREYERKVCNDG